MNRTRSLRIRNGETLVLHHIPMTFDEGTVVDVFAKKNNKTLGETLEHPATGSLRIARSGAIRKA